MIAFMRGTRTPVFTMAMPSSSSTASKAAVYLLSRSRIRYFAVAPTSWRSITRLRASCVVQAAVGWAAAPRIRTRRVACSMTAKTYSRAGQSPGFEEVGGDDDAAELDGHVLE